jgi:hypothetical protein
MDSSTNPLHPLHPFHSTIASNGSTTLTGTVDQGPSTPLPPPVDLVEWIATLEAGEADLYKDRAEEDPLRCAIEVSAHEANASKIWPGEVLTDEADYLGRGVAEGRHSSGNNVGSCWRRARDLYYASAQAHVARPEGARKTACP